MPKSYFFFIISDLLIDDLLSSVPFEKISNLKCVEDSLETICLFAVVHTIASSLVPYAFNSY